MEREFEIPLHGEDLMTAQDERYCSLPEFYEIACQEDTNGQKNLLSSWSSKLRNPTLIVEHECFDVIYGFVNIFTRLEAPIKKKLVDLIVKSGMLFVENVQAAVCAKETNEAEAVEEDDLTLRTGLKKYCFLCHWLLKLGEDDATEEGMVTDAKKKRKDASAEWEVHKLKLLSMLREVIVVQSMGRLWNMSVVEDSFVGLFVKTADALLLHSANVKHREICEHIVEIFAQCFKVHSHPSAMSGIMHLFFNYEHVAEFAAEFAHVMSEKFSCPQVALEFIREVSSVDASIVSRDSSSKNVQIFIESISDFLPRTVLANFPLLAPHLQGDSYMIRNGMLSAMASILIHCRHDTMDENLRSTRDTLLVQVLEHAHDTKSYCRGRTLQVLERLAKGGAIPNKFYVDVINASVGRLSDRTATVRKAALSLLTALLQHNPFGSHFDVAFFEKKLVDATAELDALREEYNKQTEGAADSELLTEEDKVELGVDASPEIKEKEQEIAYFQGSIEFIQLMVQGMESVAEFMSSATASDVLEAVHFITFATEFGFDSGRSGLKRMLLLVFNRDPVIKEAVIGAVEQLFLTARADLAKEERGKWAANNLVELVSGCTEAEMLSIEHCITELQKKGSIKSSLRSVLWQMLEKQTDEELPNARAAITLLSFMAKGNPRAMIDSVDSLIAAAFSEDGWRDAIVARHAATAVSTLPWGEQSEKALTAMSSMLQQPWFAGIQWCQTLEQFIGAIFAVKPDPLSSAAELMALLRHRVQTVLNEGEDVSPTLCTLFFAVGHVSIDALVHIEDSDRQLRKARHTKELAKQDAADKEGAEGDVDELGMEAAQAKEASEAEMLQAICEGKIIGPGTLLGKLSGMLLAVVQAAQGSCDDELRASAIFAMCKCMIVSEAFCDSHLRLLFTLLQSGNSSPRIRSLIVVALGDMAFRFPNLLEPWNDHMYSCLQDHDVNVRKNMLMVMTHLVLNDMIKAKGKIYMVALCLEDKDLRIQDLARLFWSEFSTKGNALYNVIPDVISNLSVSESISTEGFQSVMKLLMSSISKDKQCESLVEKLCHRISDAKETAPGLGLLFCMAQLQMSSRAIGKLVENKQSFKHLLCEDEAMEHLGSIVSKARKFAKEDMKVALEELEKILEGNEAAAVQEGAEGEGDVKEDSVLKPSNTQGGKKAKGKKAGKAAKPKRSSRRKKVESSSEEEEVSDGLSELSEMEVDDDEKENVNSPIAA